MTHRPTRVRDWLALLEAVLGASPSDEAGWVEWKSAYAWDNRAHLGALSRAIIALANRDPGEGGEYFGGHGVIIVGLEAGKLHGVEVVDSAVLEEKLDAFLGGREGPRWEQRWLHFRDHDVLVVEVQPARRGDPPYCLTTSVNDFKAGQVFVRNGAKSVPATLSDLRRLADRYHVAEKEPTLQIAVRVEDQDPMSTIHVDPVAIDRFIESEREDLLRSLPKAQGLKSPGSMPDSQGFSSFGASILNLKPETRTETAYRAEVEDYLVEVRAALPDALLQATAWLLPAPFFVVDNLSSRNLKDVHLTLSVSGEAHAVEFSEREETLADLLPSRPRSFGSHSVVSQFGMSAAAAAGWMPTLSPVTAFGRREIINGGSFTLKLEEFDLRPNQRDLVVECETVFLIPASRSGLVDVSWIATSSNVDAVTEGTIQMDFSAEPVELVEAALRSKR